MAEIASVTINSGHIVKIVGKCPMGCGSTLFIGKGGFVTCSYLKCPDPNFASVLMDQLDKIGELVILSDKISSR